MISTRGLKALTTDSLQPTGKAISRSLRTEGHYAATNSRYCGVKTKMSLWSGSRSAPGSGLLPLASGSRRELSADRNFKLGQDRYQTESLCDMCNRVCVPAWHSCCLHMPRSGQRVACIDRVLDNCHIRHTAFLTLHQPCRLPYVQQNLKSCSI